MIQQNDEPVPYSREEVKIAEASEQAALSASQNQYLTQRVVTLRAHVNRLTLENISMKNQLQAIFDSGWKPSEPEGADT